jgi:Tol biopolymer transport system component
VYQRSVSETGGGDALRLWSATGTTAVALPGRSTADIEDPAFSPDGRRIALTLIPAGGTGGAAAPDVWMLERQQGTLERFTVEGGRFAVWSPDGREIAFSRSEGIFVKRSDGTGDERLVLRGRNPWPHAWLPDGRTIVFGAALGATTRQDIGAVTIGDSVPRWLVRSEFLERHPQVSRDGLWLAYASDRTGQFEVYVQPLAGDGPRMQISTEGGRAPRWSPDGRMLYYVNTAGDSILAAARAPGTEFRIANRSSVADVSGIDLNGTNPNWDVHPDGRQFLYIDLGGGGTGAPLVWVLNWTEMVKTLGTTR